MSILESIVFEQSAADPCVYIQMSQSMAIIVVYVSDSILLTKPEDM